MSKDSSTTDVIIVGAGLAGATAAFVLSRAGVDVMLVDPTSTQPPVFKAEKIEPDQAELLRAFNLLEVLLPECRRINRIACGQNGRVWQFTEIEEYGCFYHDMVNAVRRHLPAAVQVRQARVVQARTGVEIQEVVLDDGSVVTGRLLVLATGAIAKLHEQLGLRRQMLSAGHSMSFGFNFQPTGQLPGAAESVTYRENPIESGIDYITLFPIKDVLRANMFTYWEAKDPRVQDLRTRGLDALLEMLPGLTRVTGPLVLSSKVEAMPIHLHRVEQAVQPGVILLGDVFQSVCPTTGTGLSKVLVDVQTLSSLVPEWLKTPGLGADKIARYYHDEKKRATDKTSLADALYGRRLCSDRSLAWTARRWKKLLPRWLAGFRHPQNDLGESAKQNGSRVPSVLRES
jgi:2-polyprenyl-6-methoxyphenol hydroxylase-like FAD-dependent oxidoreductase